MTNIETTYAIIDLVAHEYTVMGLGATPEAAMGDAQHWAGAEWNWRGARCAEVSAARAARIVAGDNDASDLWDSASEVAS